MFAEIAAVLLLASAPADDRPARPINRSTPDFPVSCMPKPGETMPPQKVVVVYTVTRKGAVEGARVREATDPCFNDTAIAAVRSWRFEPAKAKGVTVDQEDLETTFNFVIGETTEALDFDARPRLRIPPRYPEWCMDNADPKEVVTIEFDVTSEGKTTNAKVIDTTNACLNTAALSSVKKWKYSPKIEDGAPVERRGVQTRITFEIFGGSAPPPYRRAVGQRLNKVSADLRRNRNPKEVLADLADIEAKYGANFTRAELAAFHQLRGAAKLSAKDYRGALDDFRIARRTGVSIEAAAAVDKTIEQLEAYVAAEDAVASSENPDEAGGASATAPAGEESRSE